MKTFRDIVNETLTYTSSLEDISKFKGIEHYRVQNNGSLNTYSKNKEVIFIFNLKNKKLNVIKQGWQLLNLKRGF